VKIINYKIVTSILHHCSINLKQALAKEQTTTSAVVVKASKGRKRATTMQDWGKREHKSKRFSNVFHE
jgi:hypothetical protein